MTHDPLCKACDSLGCEACGYTGTLAPDDAHAIVINYWHECPDKSDFAFNPHDRLFVGPNLHDKWTSPNLKQVLEPERRKHAMDWTEDFFRTAERESE